MLDSILRSLLKCSDQAQAIPHHDYEAEFFFDNEKCTLSLEALSRFVVWNPHNHGGSDETTAMNFDGTLDTLFHDTGFECSPR